ncbi:MAG: primosomal protein N' [Clostridia bacterium]
MLYISFFAKKVIKNGAKGKIMTFNVAKIAVSTAIYNIDKPYSYLIPKSLIDEISVGMRVQIPFGLGNRKVEGIVLKLTFEETTKGFKNITQILDKEPLIDSNMLKLALFMQKRYYATFYEIIKTMLPSGFWFEYDEQFIKGETDGDNIAHAEILGKIAERGFIKKTDENAEIIAEMVKKGIIVSKLVPKQKANDKLLKVYSLNMEKSSHLVLADKGNAKVTRVAVVEALLKDDNVFEQQLMYQSGATKTVLATMLKQGIICVHNEQVYRENDVDYTIKKTEINLSDEQERVASDLMTEFSKNEFSQNLLFGVTGSGKTLIYIKMIAECLEKGKSAMVLIPEIALTTQLLTRFTEYFGENVAILHSKLSVSARFDEWKKIASGKCNVVIGTRSSIFAPTKNLGLIIIDEEHEQTYKSENSPRYDAKEVAKYRAFQSKALLLLASATPSIDSFYEAKNGNINLHRLDERFGEATLPNVFIYDMKEHAREGLETSIGGFLYNEIEKNLDNGEQTILFLNRRGNSKQFTCLECGYTPECVNCSTNMTYHSANERIMCHFCGYSYEKPILCPKCSSRHIKTDVAGTQKLELEVRELFPFANVLRLDADTAKGKNAHFEILEEFKKQRADILIGTQMVTKGLDFENATLVGVIDADQSLFSEDFRAKERTFSQITQVVGRAGRRMTKGRAIIQTYSPDNDVLNYARNQQYDNFYESEISRRKALKLPPINDFFTFVVTGERENDVIKSAVRTVERMKYLQKTMFHDLVVLGPTAAKIIKINKKYRYIIAIRMNDDKQKRKFVAGMLKEFLDDKRNKGVNLYVDLDGEC